MSINPSVIAATEARFAARHELRNQTLEKIRTKPLREVDSPERVLKRFHRLELNKTALLGREGFNAPVEADGLGMERVLGANDLMGIAFLELGMFVSRTVGRIRINTEGGLTNGYGTGFLVSPRLLLTNNHVLGTAHSSKFAFVEFNYQEGIFGKRPAAVTFQLDPQSFFVTDEQLDYTLVAVRERSTGSDQPLSCFGWNRLIEQQGKAILGEFLNVIQHPNGELKQLALRENQLIDLLPDFVHYKTDTAPGSSGSPVFNDQWEVVALHHSGVPEKDAAGNYLTRDGQLWRPIMGEHRLAWKANEGVRISRIVEHLKNQSLSGIQNKLRDQLLNSAPATELVTLRSEVEQASASVKTTTDGTATWTIPLTVSINLGTAKVGDKTSTPQVITRDTGAEAPTIIIKSNDSPELARALEEARRSTSRIYYDEQDNSDADTYYSSLQTDADPQQLYRALSNLVKSTHTKKPTYKPSVELYPWIDRHPDLKIRSVYSGQVYDAEELIRIDFEVQKQRQMRFQEILSREADLSTEQVQEQLDLLEASLPYNCEHVVPQSWFSKNEPMRGDLHHLFACESDCNSFRGNIPYYDFEMGDEATRTNCGRREGNKFEPEHGLGAVARATMYFLLRYPGSINNIRNEFEKNRLPILLKWHQNDPVGEYERHRNMTIYARQGNRNPLIDHPKWATNIDFALGLG